jgi:recombination protein RecA
MTVDIDALKKQLLARRRTTPIQSQDLLSSGDTLLNLMVSGKPRGCFAKGHYYLEIGDSNSGKTWINWTMLAEAAKNKNFDNYKLIYNGPEDGAIMDVAAYFGNRLDKRVVKIASTSMEDFYYHLDDLHKEGIPYIEVLDSMDALRPEAESKKFDKKKKSARGQIKEEVSGSYGTEKAKINSENLGRIIPKLKESGSILVVVGQSRSNIGFGSQFNPKTFSGGHALQFYATLQLWFSQAGKIKKDVNGKKREQGICSQVRIKKNRLTGRDRAVEIPIYHSHGIDDVGHCVSYLVDEGIWKKTKGIITTDIGLEGKEEDIIQAIETENKEQLLQDSVAKTWATIEEASAVLRKPRYQ